MVENKMSAEQMLDNLFTVVQRLYNEMRLNEIGDSNHFRVFDIFANLGRALSGADRASFWYWNKSKHQLVTAAATGTDQITIDDSEGIVGLAVTENRPVVVNDPYHHPQFNSKVDRATGYLTKSVLVMPVSNCQGEVIGAFQAINKLGSDAKFDEREDTKRLSIAAFICGMALESDIFLFASQHDKLTGLKNRFGFHADFLKKTQRILCDSKYEIPISLMMCDIDFFKKVNDTYGHNAGDAVLVHVSNILKSTTRKYDCVYRWGGEEFMAILEGATIVEAAAIAERVRLAVLDSICSFEKQDIRVTVSFGCTECDLALSVEENIKVADSRLYHAKENGRNRVVASEFGTI